MRVHPISLALRFLKGQRTMRATPFLGRPMFVNEEAAVSVLRRFTGRDFGTGAARWDDWLRRNRWVYRAAPDDPRLAAPECPHCRGGGHVEERMTTAGGQRWRKAACPVCGGSGILIDHRKSP